MVKNNVITLKIEREIMERLQKYISRCGYASRRKAEQLIVDGKVLVNGKSVTELGFKINPERDKVKVEGTLIKPEELTYILFNKPKGVITSVSDPQGRTTVMDYVKTMKDVKLFPVGRLDYNTEGLLLLTNDGALAHGLMHPSKGVVKTYEVRIKDRIADIHLEEIAKGVKLDRKMTSPANIVDYGFNGAYSTVEISIHEGRNRQVRRMFESKGYKIQNLKRISYGPLTLSGVKRGSFRKLTAQEINQLMELM